MNCEECHGNNAHWVDGEKANHRFAYIYCNDCGDITMVHTEEG